MTQHNRWDTAAVPVKFITDLTTARRELEGVLCDAERVAVDTETVILRDADGKPLEVNLDVDGPGPWRVMSIAAKFVTPHGVQYLAWVLDMAGINASGLRAAFAGVRPGGWNANFDRGVLARGGLLVRHWYDYMLAEANLLQGAYFRTGVHPYYPSLAAAAERHLGLKMDGKEDTRLSYDEHTPLTEEQIRYAAHDAINTLFVGEDIDAEAERVGLTATIRGAQDAQPFVHWMTTAGLAFDPAYQSVIDNAVAKQDAAAEEVAVLTTGHHDLRTLVRWAAQAGRLAEDPATAGARADADPVWLTEVGLPLLHDEETVSAFVAALREQREAMEANVAQLLGAEPVEDLFSDRSSFALPFGQMSDETAIRRWIGKQAPQFVAEYLAAHGSTSRNLTKANDMSDVYLAMSQAPADVSETNAKVAQLLEGYRRYGQLLAKYADLTGSITLKPDWLLDSADQVKAKLNEYAQDRVLAYKKETTKTAGLLTKPDSVDDTALKLIGGPLAEALLRYREHHKVVTTYGDSLTKFVHPKTGRIHAKYVMELTGTGRLASNKPNAQNFTPLAKPYFRQVVKAPDGTLISRAPGGAVRVLVAADLSQAELRFLAHSAGDENMLSAFRSGEDLHERTASLMFSVDLKSLNVYGGLPVGQIGEDVAGLASYAKATPEMAAKDLYKQLRSKAKAVSFGYAYGLKGASLASQLTVQGVPTTREEANELLAKFDASYPQVAAWMANRVKFIDDLAASVRDQSQDCGADFEASWKLHRLYAKAIQVHDALKRASGEEPDPATVAAGIVPDDQLRERLTASGELTDEDAILAAMAEVRGKQATEVAWALGHYGSAVLATDGTPWSFESRNLGNRRRLFQIGTADWVKAMVKLVAGSRKAYARQVSLAWQDAYNQMVTEQAEAASTTGRQVKPKLVNLSREDPRSHKLVPLLTTELEKAMEDKAVCDSFVTFVLAEYAKLAQGAAARDYLFRHAMAECISRASNQFRNHPIQSGVADAVLTAMGRIDADLITRFPTACPVQSVHDSIVIECDLADALAVKEMLVRHMEAALSEMCPSVPCRADGDVQLSLDDHTKLSEEEIAELLNALVLAA